MNARADDGERSALVRGAREVPGRWPRRVLVRGSSMVPTLHDGDVVLAWPGRRARAGDVALVRWPSRPGQLSVKRLALPDDGGWYALGDAALASTDSRTLGPAEALAVVTHRLWPHPGRLPRR
ncbi:S26 family signal peptidase [Actinomycetospora termitidis]|uniref:S24 family peptidase n=1 Tax=Actinomycetospora termitidis TaxID=3053470 RepID=A0ABT7M9M3_9PSEU|nr:S26 family signal peptidase [Actinomycetospora sp. Odt1-22]MDL5157151.1 S24 family peptidase [Actinomycetospora sp. Odt1-22]